MTALALLLALLASANESGDLDLVVYPAVPGLPASSHYQVRVRAAGAGGPWETAFVCDLPQ